jgi:hypothetical protein
MGRGTRKERTRRAIAEPGMQQCMHVPLERECAQYAERKDLVREQGRQALDPHTRQPGYEIRSPNAFLERLEIDDSVAAAMAEEMYIDPDPDPIPDRYLVEYNE